MRNGEIERGADWEFVRGRRRWREVDVEVHGAAEGRAEMSEPLVVASEHLAAADLGGFCLHIWFWIEDFLGLAWFWVSERSASERLRFYIQGGYNEEGRLSNLFIVFLFYLRWFIFSPYNKLLTVPSFSYVHANLLFWILNVDYIFSFISLTLFFFFCLLSFISHTLCLSSFFFLLFSFHYFLQYF